MSPIYLCSSIQQPARRVQPSRHAPSTAYADYTEVLRTTRFFSVCSVSSVVGALAVFIADAASVAGQPVQQVGKHLCLLRLVVDLVVEAIPDSERAERANLGGKLLRCRC